MCSPPTFSIYPNSSFSPNELSDSATLTPIPLLPPHTPLSPILQSITDLTPDSPNFSFIGAEGSETQNNSIAFAQKIQSPLLTDHLLSPLPLTEEQSKEKEYYDWLG